jgi:hypothetical protein
MAAQKRFQVIHALRACFRYFNLLWVCRTPGLCFLFQEARVGELGPFAANYRFWFPSLEAFYWLYFVDSFLSNIAGCVVDMLD